MDATQKIDNKITIFGQKYVCIFLIISSIKQAHFEFYLFLRFAYCIFMKRGKNTEKVV